ncbi:hypothetical protein R75483_03886 [Paraburkholderia domus]|nr:hypothetical protein R75483_03886 [Paraburkholderia domus]
MIEGVGFVLTPLYVRARTGYWMLLSFWHADTGLSEPPKIFTICIACLLVSTVKQPQKSLCSSTAFDQIRRDSQTRPNE